MSSSKWETPPAPYSALIEKTSSWVTPLWRGRCEVVSATKYDNSWRLSVAVEDPRYGFRELGATLAGTNLFQVKNWLKRNDRDLATVLQRGRELRLEGHGLVNDRGVFYLRIRQVDHHDRGPGPMTIWREEQRKLAHASRLVPCDPPAEKRPASWESVNDVLRRINDRRILVLGARKLQGTSDLLADLQKSKMTPLVDFGDTPLGGARERVVRGICATLADPDLAGKYGLIILGRGGGSTVDLATYDDYRLASAIHCCPVPVAVAIGHRSDLHLAGEVANLQFTVPAELGKRLHAGFARIRKAEQRPAHAAPKIQSTVDDRLLRLEAEWAARLRQAQTDHEARKSALLRSHHAREVANIVDSASVRIQQLHHQRAAMGLVSTLALVGAGIASTIVHDFSLQVNVVWSLLVLSLALFTLFNFRRPRRLGAACRPPRKPSDDVIAKFRSVSTVRRFNKLSAQLR